MGNESRKIVSEIGRYDRAINEALQGQSISVSHDNTVTNLFDQYSKLSADEKDGFVTNLLFRFEICQRRECRDFDSREIVVNRIN